MTHEMAFFQVNLDKKVREKSRRIKEAHDLKKDVVEGLGGGLQNVKVRIEEQ